jgi:DNA-binding NtrC family response regulator
VIVVSGAGVMNDAVEALRLGAADYLIKPLEDLAVLEHSVRRALDRARLLLENQRYREKLEAPTASSKPACTCCRKTRTPVARCR